MFLTIEKKYNPYFNKKSKEPVMAKPVEEKEEDKKKGSKGYWRTIRRGAMAGGGIGLLGMGMNPKNIALSSLGGAALASPFALRDTKYDTEEQKRTKKYALRGMAIGTGLGLLGGGLPGALYGGLQGSLIGGLAGSSRNKIKEYNNRKKTTENK